MDAPALSKTGPVVETTTLAPGAVSILPAIVSVSLVLPDAPASSVILPPAVVWTKPELLMVSGLFVFRLMLPDVVETVPETVSAPVLRILMSLLALLTLAPVRELTLVEITPPWPMPSAALAEKLDPVITPLLWLMAPAGDDSVTVPVPALTGAPSAIFPALALRETLPLKVEMPFR